MTKTGSKWLIRALKMTILAAILWLLWRAVDWAEALVLMRSAQPGWLAVAALALTLQTILSALRWRITAARLGIEISVTEALGEYYLSQVVNQSLPGGVVGDASRAMRARGQAGIVASGQAVVFERLSGQLGLLAVLGVGLLVALIVPTGMAWPMWLIVPVVIGATALCITALGLLWQARADTALGRGLRSFRYAVTAPPVWRQQAALSLGTALCNIAAFGFCAVALGVALPLLAAISLVPLILFAMVLPLSISGWGLREGAAAVLFPLIGASMSAGLATSVAFGLVFLCTVIPGLLLTWLRPIAPVLGRR
ncbi:flippase-like domain-containing protein [Rhodobacteraceae bacterium M385]|nr:flippase-like domain-containing protein [Rhodobacteraceae bacterium M385]